MNQLIKFLAFMGIIKIKVREEQRTMSPRKTLPKGFGTRQEPQPWTERDPNIRQGIRIRIQPNKLFYFLPVVVSGIFLLQHLFPTSDEPQIQEPEQVLPKEELKQQVEMSAKREVSEYWKIKYERGDYTKAELEELESQLPEINALNCNELINFFTNEERSNLRAHSAHLILERNCLA